MKDKNKINKAKRSFWSAAFFIGALTTIIIGLLDNGINGFFAVLIGMCVCSFLRYVTEGVLFLFEKHDESNDNNDSTEKEL